jgi:pimeloyl-ACP methyl ester carboxylesterase
MTNPFQEFGKQQGETLLFAHANGFPPSTYTALLAELGQEHRILAPHLRPLWQELTEFQSSASNRAVWQHMAQDQNDFIEQHQLAPVTYIGHSMGANVGVLAAQLKPHLYRQLILIEPVFLRQTIARIIRFGPQILINKAPIVAKALGRPDRWDNLQQAFDFHRPKRVFLGLTDEVLWHYINAAVVPDRDGVKLLYSKHWEALMYGSVPNIWPYLKRSVVPISVLRGESSDTVDDLAWKRWQALRPAASLPEHIRAVNFVGSGHLLPLEQPVQVALKVRLCTISPT